MNYLNNLLTWTMEIPKPYGPFHITSIILMIITTILISLFYKNCSDKTFRRIVFIFWIIILSFEIYKQIFYTFFYTPLNVYKMYVFPFQFCSTPLYIYPLICFMKDSKVRDSLLIFASTFIFFGGFGLYMVPTSYQEVVGINIQTMVHHGTQIVIGIFIVVHEHDKFTFKNYLNSMIVFGIVLLIALSLNEIVYPFLNSDNNDFNLFYISRHVTNYLPVLAPIWEKNYILFLSTYVFGFMGISLVLYLLEKYIYNLVHFLNVKSRTHKTS